MPFTQPPFHSYSNCHPTQPISSNPLDLVHSFSTIFCLFYSLMLCTILSSLSIVSSLTYNTLRKTTHSLVITLIQTAMIALIFPTYSLILSSYTLYDYHPSTYPHIYHTTTTIITITITHSVLLPFLT